MKMRKTFSLALAIVMVLLMVPFGATAALPTAPADTTDSVYVAALVTNEFDGYFDTLDEALVATNANVASNKAEIIQIEIKGDTTHNSATNGSNGKNCNIRANVRIFAAPETNYTIYTTNTGGTQVLVLGGQKNKVTFENLTFKPTSDNILFSPRDGSTLELINVNVDLSDGAYSNAEKYMASLQHDDTTLIIDGGTYKGSAAKYMIQMEWNGNSNLLIKDGTFTAKAGKGIVYNNKAGNVTIEGGTFNAYGPKDTDADYYPCIVNNKANGTLDIKGGTFNTSGSDCYAVMGGAQSTTTIWDGDFNGDVKQILTIEGVGYIYGGTFDNAADVVIDFKGASGRGYVFGGTFTNTKTAASNNGFIIRPRTGASTTIYGGTFVSNGSTLGSGESKNVGYLYIFGGDFYDLNKTGDILALPLNSAANPAYTTKNVYIYSGNFYTVDGASLTNLQKNATVSYTPTGGSKITLKTNEVFADALTVTTTNVTITKNGAAITKKTTISYDVALDTTATNKVTLPTDGKTYGIANVDMMLNYMACDGAVVEAASGTVSSTRDMSKVWAKSGVSLTGVTFAGTLTENDAMFTKEVGAQYREDGDNAVDVRVAAKIQISEQDLANYTTFGFLVSIRTDDLVMYADGVVSNKMNTVYTSVKAGGDPIDAGEGYYWLVLGIDDIPAAAYGTTINVRPYAMDAEGNITVGDVFDFTAQQIINATNA